jgi:uncharacterized protein (TIGR03435 family)
MIHRCNSTRRTHIVAAYAYLTFRRMATVYAAVLLVGFIHVANSAKAAVDDQELSESQVRQNRNPSTERAASPLSFEVASIKPSRSNPNLYAQGDCQGKDSNPRSRYKPGFGRCAFRGFTLKELVSAAYSPVSFGGRLGFPVDRIEKASGFSWIESDRFDIEAKAEDTSNVSEEQLYTMLRQLLVERFRLRLRHMTKDVSGYQLDVAPSGSKLQEAPAEASPLIGGGPPSGGLMVGKAVPVSAIVTFLSGRLGRPIQDRTGLSGRYNWELKWMPDENEFRIDGGPVTRGVSDAGPSLITAVREQLGLRLVSTRIAIEMLYINHAEKPKAN